MRAFLFAGQGAQKPGMGKSIYECSAKAREVFAKVSEATGRDMKALCFESEPSQLNLTENAQLALYTTDLAIAAALGERGIHADLCAGFSLGEYPALVYAGALSLEEGAKLVEKRSAFMAACEGGAMAAVLGLNAGEVESACAALSAYAAPVNYNCPGQIVVAGDAAAIKELRAQLKAQKIRCLPLKVSGAFHSEQMNEAADRLKPYLDQADWHTPALPLFLNVSGEQAGKEDQLAEIMFRQCKSPVYWEKEIRGMIALGADTFIECGPGGTLTGFMGRIDAERQAVCVADQQSLEQALGQIKQ